MLKAASGFMRREAAALKSALFERRCVFCTEVIRPATGVAEAATTLKICVACLKKIPLRRSGYCIRCGEFFSWEGLDCGICRQCLESPPPWGRVFFHGGYSGYLRKLIHRVKFMGGLPEARWLGELLAEHPLLSGAMGGYDCIIPVPLHPKTLRERGFNQAIELARPVARRFAVSIESGILERSVNTRRQVGLSRRERSLNMKGVFSVKGEAKGGKILLFDDVLTTGTTLVSAARCLLEAGAAVADVAVVARTPAHDMLAEARRQEAGNAFKIR